MVCYYLGTVTEKEGKIANSPKGSAEVERGLPPVEEPVQQSSLPVQPTLSEEDKRTRLDFALAICICLAAAIFWFWDGTPASSNTTAQTAPRTAAPGSSLADSYNNQGSQLYRAGDYAGAEALFRRAIAADPQGALGYCNLGAALIPQQKYDEAIAALQRSITLDPTSTLARNNLKWALDEKAKHKQ